MKSILKISNMNTSSDITKVRNSISRNEGVIAFYIDKEKLQVEVIYDDKLLNLEDMIDSIEKLGYIII
ncbi:MULTISPECIES: heavy-metal-associated domain-containing protein [Clostridium]|uniref:heavy-metal-associated domain-containing protein n=1 Tax=Clostridium TaxID=1485 RepID=UPI0008255971|nr:MULTISPECIES: heavy-metal-associated domain-containing protein [Clostridium]PJI08055.1 copper chaperone [Clostridium sp. CT7]